MMHSKYLVVLAGLTLGIGSVASAQSDANRAYAADLAADAAKQSSLLGAQSDSGLVISGQIQIRYTINSRDATAGDEDSTVGFSNRRTKLDFSGALNEEWGYKVLGAFSSSGGTFSLDEAFVTYKMDENWTWTFGQFKAPWLREENVSSRKQLASDRSVMNEFFNQDRSQGVQAAYKGDNVRVKVAFTDGFATRNTEFNSTSEADYSLTGRLEWKWAGVWDRFDDFTSFRSESEYAGMLGGSLHWQSGGETGGPTPDMEMMGITIDASAEGRGWNAYAAFVWTSFEPAVGSDLDDMGFLIQGGIFMADQWEAFGRYDVVLADDSRGAGIEDTFSTITVGLNHYIIPDKHTAKFTVDLRYFLDQQSTSVVSPDAGIGLLADTGDSQWALTGQLQLLF